MLTYLLPTFLQAQFGLDYLFIYFIYLALKIVYNKITLLSEHSPFQKNYVVL